MVYFNLLVAAVFVGLMALGYAYFLTTGRRREAALAPRDERLDSRDFLRPFACDGNDL